MSSNSRGKRMPQNVSKKEEFFGLDKRSLALFRIGLGALVMLDGISRLPDVKAHYSDEGVFPRSVALDNFWNYTWFCIHLVNGTWQFQSFLFLVQAVFGFMLSIGFYTRTFTVLSWFIVVSAQAKNHLVGHGGDVLLRMLLFWAVFLPLEKCYSIDRTFYKRKKRISSNILFSGGSFAIIMQIVFLYVFSYLHKTGDEWRVDGTATYLALNLDFFRTSFGDLMLYSPELLKIMTFTVLYYEGFGSLLFFSPVLTQQLRTLAALGYFGLHVGFGLSMNLGTFSPICCVGVLPLLAPWFWDGVVFRFLQTQERSGFRVFYVRNTSGEPLAHFVADFLLVPGSEVTCSQDSSKDKAGFYVVDHRGTKTTGFEAFQSVCKVSPLLYPLHLFMCTGMGEIVTKFVYTFVKVFYVEYFESEANNGPQPAAPVNVTNRKPRRSLGKTRRTIVSAIAIACILFCFVWNCDGVQVPYVSLPKSLLWVGWITHIEQGWTMFSPRPPNENWWYTIEGTLDDGRKVEIWGDKGMFNWVGHPAPYNREIPNNLPDCIGNHRWWKFYEFINAGPNEKEIRLPFGRYICREYNNRHPGKDRVHTFDLIYRSLVTQIGAPRTPKDDLTFWSHQCYDKSKGE